MRFVDRFQSGISLEGLEVTRPTLEDVYLDITKDFAGAETPE